MSNFIHEKALVETGNIGDNTRIWGAVTYRDRWRL